MTDNSYNSYDRHDQVAVLREMIADIDRLIRETRTTRRDLVNVTKEANELLARGEISALRYDIEQERIRRAYENVNFCLRRLDHQKKLIIEKLLDHEK